MKFKFTAKSDSRADVTYNLTVDTTVEVFTCNCPGHTGHGYCKHARNGHLELSLVKLFVARVRRYRKNIDGMMNKKDSCTHILSSYLDPHTKAIIRKWGKFVMLSL
jgi:hypothetical protein